MTPSPNQLLEPTAGRCGDRDSWQSRSRGECAVQLFPANYDPNACAWKNGALEFQEK